MTGGDEGSLKAATPAPHWNEVYAGGSAEEEQKLFRGFAEAIEFVQQQNARRAGDQVVRRAFHAKTHAGIVNATFRVAQHIAPDLAQGIFRPGRTYQAIVRFSNAAGIVQADSTPDLRGVGIRLAEDRQDFLLTNAAASHARDAAQFMAAAEAFARPRPVAPLILARRVGLREAVRIVRDLRIATGRKIVSLAEEPFWSRAPYAIGPVAVRFKLQPETRTFIGRRFGGRDYLRDEFVERLRRGPVLFSLRAQRYVDEARTPIEDGAVAWSERDAPPEDIAELVIPQQDLATPAAREAEAFVDGLAFDPWNTSPDIHPIGSLNRARSLVYRSSATNRGWAPE